MSRKHEKYDKEQTWSSIWGPGGLELPEAVADAMRIPAGATVLDAGAGSGEISCFLAAEYGWHVLAMDGGADAIQERANARSLAGSVVGLKGDLTDLQLASDSVDGLICLGTFEMLQDARPRAMVEMKRVVRPGGPIGIGEPMLTRDLPAEEAERLYGPEDELGFRKCFRTLEWNKELAGESGLEIVEAYQHPRAQDLWDDYYRPLFDDEGTLKHPERRSEVEIWQRDGGNYHGLGVVVLRQAI